MRPGDEESYGRGEVALGLLLSFACGTLFGLIVAASFF